MFKMIPTPAADDVVGMELHFAGAPTWRLELMVENWDGAPVMTQDAARILAAAKAELAARQTR